MPSETHVAPTPVYPINTTVTSLPVGTGTGLPPSATTSKLPEYTGAASVQKLGSLMVAAGLVAALF